VGAIARTAVELGAAADLDRLRELHRRNPRQFATETESTANRLRSLLSPLVRSIFADQTNTINFSSELPLAQGIQFGAGEGSGTA